MFKHKHKFEIIRTIWPYPDGWGVWCPKCKTVIDTGLPKEEAQESAKELNTQRRRSVLDALKAVA